MEPSEEIRRVVERWTLAISERDVDAALGRLSDNPGALIIGTDAAEWWHGHEAHAVMRRQLEELGFPREPRGRAEGARRLAPAIRCWSRLSD
jgi:SnoaL-like domain